MKLGRLENRIAPHDARWDESWLGRQRDTDTARDESALTSNHRGVSVRMVARGDASSYPGVWVHTMAIRQ